MGMLKEQGRSKGPRVSPAALGRVWRSLGSLLLFHRQLSLPNLARAAGRQPADVALLGRAETTAAATFQGVASSVLQACRGHPRASAHRTVRDAGTVLVWLSPL